MLTRMERQQTIMVMQYRIVVQHFSINCRLFGKQADEVAEVRVRDIDHGSDAEQGLVHLHMPNKLNYY